MLRAQWKDTCFALREPRSGQVDDARLTGLPGSSKVCVKSLWCLCTVVPIPCSSSKCGPETTPLVLPGMGLSGWALHFAKVAKPLKDLNWCWKQGGHSCTVQHKASVCESCQTWPGSAFLASAIRTEVQRQRCVWAPGPEQRGHWRTKVHSGSGMARGDSSKEGLLQIWVSCIQKIQPSVGPEDSKWGLKTGFRLSRHAVKLDLNPGYQGS